MKKILNLLFDHHQLDQNEAKIILGNITDGDYSAEEVAAFLTVFKMRSISVDELIGFRNCLKDRCVRIDLSGYDPIDMCGTGGDGKNTFNISTLASVVVAAAGFPVAKHGNYGVSSACGSSNVMEYLGFKFSDNFDRIQRQMEQCNLTFLHAPLFHPAMKAVAPIRKQLGVSTFFNMLGPMVNPAFPKKQIVGVYSIALQRYYKHVYENEDIDYYIVHSLDGYDEISLTADAMACGRGEDQRISPQDFNVDKLTQEQLSGGNTIKEAAAIFSKILHGEGTQAQCQVVAANAALAIHCTQPSTSLIDAYGQAKEAIVSGRAMSTFKTLLTL